MNTSNAQSKAKKRLKGLFSSYKGNEKDFNSQIKWDMNKTYSFVFHDKAKFEVFLFLFLLIPSFNFNFIDFPLLIARHTLKYRNFSGLAGQ